MLDHFRFVSSEEGDLVPTTAELTSQDGWNILYRPQNEGSFTLFELWTAPSGISHWRVLNREGKRIYKKYN